MNTRTPSFGLFRVSEMSTGRIQAFSDGVFSIVVTLLVLEIHVPYVTGPNVSVELAHNLFDMMPKFFSYALSFAIVCIWWVAHHHLFDVLRKSDRGLLWFNSLFLFWLAFIPFPTALLGDYPNERIAVICYGGVMLLAGLSFSWMRYYAFFIGQLTYTDIDQDLLKRAMIKSVFNPTLHLSAVLLAFVSTKLAITLYVVIPMLFFVPSRLERHTMKRDRALE
jgi:uncharacterized membrane protein